MQLQNLHRGFDSRRRLSERRTFFARAAEGVALVDDNADDNQREPRTAVIGAMSAIVKVASRSSRQERKP